MLLSSLIIKVLLKKRMARTSAFTCRLSHPQKVSDSLGFDVFSLEYILIFVKELMTYIKDSPTLIYLFAWAEYILIFSKCLMTYMCTYVYMYIKCSLSLMSLLWAEYMFSQLLDSFDWSKCLMHEYRYTWIWKSGAWCLYFE